MNTNEIFAPLEDAVVFSGKEQIWLERSEAEAILKWKDIASEMIQYSDSFSNKLFEKINPRTIRVYLERFGFKPVIKETGNTCVWENDKFRVFGVPEDEALMKYSHYSEMVRYAILIDLHIGLGKSKSEIVFELLQTQNEVVSE